MRRSLVDLLAGVIPKTPKPLFTRKNLFNSLETLAGCTEAVPSEVASIINDAHWLRSCVSGNSSIIILNYILLNNGVSRRLSLTLAHGFLIHINLWNKSIVAGDVTGNLCCPNG